MEEPSRSLWGRDSVPIQDLLLGECRAIGEVQLAVNQLRLGWRQAVLAEHLHLQELAGLTRPRVWDLYWAVLALNPFLRLCSRQLVRRCNQELVFPGSSNLATPRLVVQLRRSREVWLGKAGGHGRDRCSMCREVWVPMLPE